MHRWGTGFIKVRTVHTEVRPVHGPCPLQTFGDGCRGPGIARHQYKQVWKFLTLWDSYGLSEATWEPMSAFIQLDGTINPIFRSYLVENNEGQLLTRTETLSQRKKKN